MRGDDLHEPFRTSTDAYRLEALGFHLAKMVIAPEARAREESDPGFREDLGPLRDLLRTHVFSDRASRDAACRSPMPGGVFALEPVDAGDLIDPWRTVCMFAVGHGVDHPAFEDVASTIADPELVGLAERCGDGARSIVFTVSGAHYQLLVDRDGEAEEVRAKGPFEVVPEDELTRTATWLLERLMGWVDLEAKSRRVS